MSNAVDGSKEKIFGTVDKPIRDGQICGSVVSVEGWAFSDARNDVSIEVYVNGKLFSQISTNKKRADVFADYPDSENSIDSGFYTEINLDELKDGDHILEVFAKTYLSSTSIGKRIITLRNDELIPTKELMEYVGSSKYDIFKTIGENWLRLFVDSCGLQKDQKVLDVGCGSGRMAIPLTKHLSDGVYEGFDISNKAIGWCKKCITNRYPNFHFIHADIYNKEYNKLGKMNALDYKFPYYDDYFDLVFLTSVFTHMRPNEVEHYFSEIRRVLKKGGKCVITFFLLNNESIGLVNQGVSELDFKHNFGTFYSMDKDTPERGIAYREEYVLNLFKKHGFDIMEPIHYGGWCKRKEHLWFQDIIISIKN